MPRQHRGQEVLHNFARRIYDDASMSKSDWTETECGKKIRKMIEDGVDIVDIYDYMSEEFIDNRDINQYSSIINYMERNLSRDTTSLLYELIRDKILKAPCCLQHLVWKESYDWPFEWPSYKPVSSEEELDSEY